MHTRDLWIFLFFAGAVLFNWPMLSIAGDMQPFYIFAVWAGFVAVVGFFSASGRYGGEGE